MARPRNAISRYKRSKKITGDQEPRKALLYARVSTRDQEQEGYSIPAQVNLLEDYAAFNGIISAHGDPLEVLARVVDFEAFRPTLDAALTAPLGISERTFVDLYVKQALYAFLDMAALASHSIRSPLKILSAVVVLLTLTGECNRLHE